MRISNKIFNFLIVVLLFPTHSLSQDDVEEWDVTLARGKTRDISFQTNEGTWMSVDISPNRIESNVAIGLAPIVKISLSIPPTPVAAP